MLVTKAAECVSSHDARPPRPRPRPRPGFPPVLSPASTQAPTPTSRTISKTSTRASSPGFRPGTPPRTSNDRVRAWATTTTSPPGSTSGSCSPRNPSRRAPPEQHPTSSPCSPRSSAARPRRRASQAKTTGDWPARISRITTRRVGFFRGNFQRGWKTATTGERSSGPWAPRGSSSRPPSPPSPRSSSSRAPPAGQRRGRAEPRVAPRPSPPQPPHSFPARRSWRAGSNPTAPRVSTAPGTTPNVSSRRRPCPSYPRATTTTTHSCAGTQNAPYRSSARKPRTTACAQLCRQRSAPSPSSRRGWRRRSRSASG
mmetsp:Transcript_879/g.3723  ORF Transcript_879/g.3723 Transcript_879/m.3723 type:complete len:313 (-) Transcript_879:330-1268(-)